MVSPSTSFVLPMPGSPGSSWAMYRARLSSVFHGADSSVMLAFFLLGIINNVLYVIILSAALDLVGPSIPKGVVLLADVLPSFLTKLVCPYFIHKIPYSVRVLLFAGISSTGMLLIALSPATVDAGAIGVKLVGIMLASLSSGAGESSFLGLTHYYGPFSLAAWGSGTGAAGLAGAGLYVLLTTWIGFSVQSSLFASAFLPAVMLFSFFVILPRAPLQMASRKLYDISEEDHLAASSLLRPRPSSPLQEQSKTGSQIRRLRGLFVPYMLPLLMVYIAEYTINQGVAPTLLFPLDASPFQQYRSFYPFYSFLYQFGVFFARSSTPFVRLNNLYLPSILQVVNLMALILQAMFMWIPSVYLVFLVIFWEGLLGGAVYVNTFAEIMDTVPEADREFSLGATSVSDSAGICIASFIGMALEVWLCTWQVDRGRNWCKQL